MRWRILNSGIGTRLGTAQKIIRACASLHNMSLEWEDPLPEGDEIGEENDAPVDAEEWDFGGTERIRGQAKRDWICDEYF